jgi:hypothetical protein
MNHLMRFPLLVLVLSFVVLWLAARIGASFRGLEENEREDFGVISAAVLTLLGLIIGFSFSMASNRYDQRKDLEEAEAEANAIGTEYLRTDYLPAAEASRVRALLTNYLDQRLLFYTTREDRQLGQINSTTARIESELWSTIASQLLRSPPRFPHSSFPA